MTYLKISLLVVVGIYVLSGIGLYFFQERLLFLDEKLPRDYQFKFSSPFQEVFLPTEDGHELHALHFTHEQPKGLIVYFHGNAKSIKRWGHVVQHPYQMGYNVLVMDYRGYGKSTGPRSQEAFLSDAQLWYDYAKTLFPEDQITLYGRSLGSGIACYAAQHNHPKQLILETPYADLGEVAQRYYPIFPVKLTLRFNFRSQEYIKGVSCPTTIFHGTADKVVPYSQGKKLFEAAPEGQTTLITIPGGKHHNLGVYDRFQEEMEKILGDG